MTRTLLKKEERMKLALDLMKERGTITMTDYVEAGIGSRTSAHRDLTYLASAFPEHVHRKRGKAAGRGTREPDLFIYKEDDRMENKYDNTKNESGANDPTAAKAFMEATGTTKELKVGDIWWYTASNGCKFMHLILATGDDSCTTCAVRGRGDKKLDMYGASTITIYDYDEPLYADVSELHTKPNKYASELIHRIDNTDMLDVRVALEERLGIKPQKVVEEKIVEKPMEIPEGMMLVPSADVDSIWINATDYALLCQKAALWEKAFYAVAAGKVAE